MIVRNYSKLVYTILSFLFYFLLINTAWAGSDKHNHPFQKKHVHGVAELNLALEGNQLELSLDSPAVNIIGFENRATTSEQTQSVNSAKQILESVDKLFLFNGTVCYIKNKHIDFSSVMKEGKKNHHDTHNEYKILHTEISAHYRFDCAKSTNLTSITVAFLEHFPGINKLKVMWVTHTAQGAVDLTQKSKLIRLR